VVYLVVLGEPGAAHAVQTYQGSLPGGAIREILIATCWVCLRAGCQEHGVPVWWTSPPAVWFVLGCLHHRQCLARMFVPFAGSSVPGSPMAGIPRKPPLPPGLRPANLPESASRSSLHPPGLYLHAYITRPPSKRAHACVQNAFLQAE
jgi:hypothetical protein